MGANVDCSSSALGLTNGPVLIEAGSADDGRSVVPAALDDVVGSSINSDAAEPLTAARRIVGTEVLDNVVFDQRVLGPAINGQIAVASWVEGSAVGNISGRSLVSYPGLN